MRLTTVRFKTFVSAQEARPAPPLGPLLGQYGLSIIQFCDDLNRLTANYQKGVILPISVEKSPLFLKGYDIVVKPPTVSFLFSMVFFENEGDFADSVGAGIGIATLFDLAKIYSVFHSESVERSAGIVFSFLNSVSGSSFKVQV